VIGLLVGRQSGQREPRDRDGCGEALKKEGLTVAAGSRKASRAIEGAMCFQPWVGVVKSPAEGGCNVMRRWFASLQRKVVGRDEPAVEADVGLRKFTRLWREGASLLDVELGRWLGEQGKGVAFYCFSGDGEEMQFLREHVEGKVALVK
jgi:hypothetical protein